MFITPPSFGNNSWIPSRQNKKIAPNKNIASDIVRTAMIVICITFVLSMLRKLNTAPEIKNKQTQNLKSRKKYIS